MTKLYEDAFRCQKCYRLGWVRKIPGKDICQGCAEEQKYNGSIVSKVMESVSQITASISGLFINKEDT